MNDPRKARGPAGLKIATLEEIRDRLREDPSLAAVTAERVQILEAAARQCRSLPRHRKYAIRTKRPDVGPRTFSLIPDGFFLGLFLSDPTGDRLGLPRGATVRITAEAWPYDGYDASVHEYRFLNPRSGGIHALPFSDIIALWRAGLLEVPASHEKRLEIVAPLTGLSEEEIRGLQTFLRFNEALETMLVDRLDGRCPGLRRALVKIGARLGEDPPKPGQFSAMARRIIRFGIAAVSIRSRKPHFHRDVQAIIRKATADSYGEPSGRPHAPRISMRVAYAISELNETRPPEYWFSVPSPSTIRRHVARINAILDRFERNTRAPWSSGEFDRFAARLWEVMRERGGFEPGFP